MISEAQKAAVDRYNKANTTTVLLRLNKNTDSDIIEYLESVGNKSGLIKELIRTKIKGMV